MTDPAPSPALLVPIDVEVLVVRPDRTDFVLNGDFTQPGTGPTAWATRGEATGSAAAAWNAVTAADGATTTTGLVPTGPGGPALRLRSDQPGGGIIQHLQPARSAPVPERVVVALRLQVLSGVFVVATGDGTTLVDGSGEFGPSGGQWQSVRFLASPRGQLDPAHPTGLAAAPVRSLAVTAVRLSAPSQPAECLIGDVVVRAFGTDNLLTTSTRPATAPVTVMGGNAVAAAPAGGWDVVHRDASAAATTTVSATPAGSVSVSTNAPACGLRQSVLFGGTGPIGMLASAAVTVTRGQIGLRVGADTPGPLSPGATATAPTGPQPTLLTAPNDTAPGQFVDVYAVSPGGADFTIESVWVRPQPWPQLLVNGDFATAAAAGPVVVGPGRDQTPPANYAGGDSAAANWTVWVNSGTGTVTTELRPTTRPGGAGNMTNVQTTEGASGLVHTFNIGPTTGPQRVVSAMWIQVVTGTVGRVGIGTGDGGNTSLVAYTAATDEWQYVEAPNGVWPANELVIYAENGAAEYNVDLATVAEVAPWSAVAATAGGPAPFTDLARSRPVGIHLHVKPPDTLSRALFTEAQPPDHRPRPYAAPRAAPAVPVRFPPLPDRHLIVRLAAATATTGTQATRAATAWLLSRAEDSTPVVTPLLVDGRTPNPAPVLPTATPAPLTVVGNPDTAPDPAWAAYADATENVLSFHDPLVGVIGPLAYLVIGWHTDPTTDPLGGPTPPTLDKLGWTLPSDNNAPQPVRTVYHGCAVAIGWPELGWLGDQNGVLSTPVDQRPDGAGLAVAVGATLPDALGELLAQPGTSAEQRQILQAFLAQSATELLLPGGPTAEAAARHSSAFDARAIASGQEAIYQPPPPPPPQTAPIPAARTADRSPVITGGLAEALAASRGHLAAPSAPADPNYPAGGFQTVARTQPRTFVAADPVVVVEGGGRSFRHGGDGRFRSDGLLGCRLGNRTITTLGPAADGGGPPPASFLAGALTAAGLPAECQSLLVELVALDPGSAPPPPTGSTGPSPALVRTSWWTGSTSGSSAVQPDGDLPSLLAVTPPTVPFTPVHLDWSVSYQPADGDLARWHLKGLDLTPDDTIPLAPATGSTHAGRTLISDGPAVVLTGATTATLAIAAAHTATDDTAGETAGDPAGADVLDAPTDAAPAARTAIADLVGGRLTDLLARVPTAGTGSPAIRAGALRITRARLVSGFGQVVDLLGSGPTVDIRAGAVGYARTAVPTAVPAADPAAPAGSPADEGQSALVLPPRLTTAARIVFRYVDANAEPGAPAADADAVISPICGYLIPDYVDHVVEFFAADGSTVGAVVQPDTGDSAPCRWEAAPGAAAIIGATPSDAIPNAALGAFADALLQADIAAFAPSATPGDRALCALLRVIDTARLTIGMLPAGDEHLALLLGRPACVAAARLTLEIDPGTVDDTTPVQVRLGLPDRITDGLLGYFLDGDYSRLHVDPSVAADALPCPGDPSAIVGSLTAPYLVTDQVTIRPGQTVDLTLLIEPSAEVTLTTGLLAQKIIGQRRDWIDTAMRRLTPSIRGTILTDPVQITAPLPDDIPGTYLWLHRSDRTTWQADPVVPVTTAPLLPAGRPVIQDGWLRIALAPLQTWDAYGLPIEVTTLNKPDRDNPLAPVLRIGGRTVDTDGVHPWALTLAEALAVVRTGRFRLWTAGPSGTQVDLAVIPDPRGHDTITAVPPGVSDAHDLLLDLPETGIELALDMNSAHLFTLTNLATGGLLSLDSPVTVEDGAAIGQRVLDPTTGEPDNGQLWMLAYNTFPNAPGDNTHSYFNVVAWNTGTAMLAVDDDALQPDAAVVQQVATAPGPAWAQWQLVAVEDGAVALYARHTGMCLSARKPGAGGPTIVQRLYTADPGQHWQVAPVARAPGLLDATTLSSTLVTPVYPGEGSFASVTVRNTGEGLWYPAFDAQGWASATPLWVDSVPTASGAVLRGQTVTLTVAAIAPTASFASAFLPTAAGVTPVNGHLAAPSVQKVAVAATSAISRGAVPTQMSGSTGTGQHSLLLAGDRLDLTVIMQNAGNVGWWAETGYEMDLVPQSPWPGNTVFDSFLRAPAPSGQGCAPGARCPLSVSAVARAPGMVIDLSMQMRHGNDAFGEPTPPWRLEVVGAVDLLEPSGAPIPNFLRPGFPVTVVAKLNQPAPRATEIELQVANDGTVATIDRQDRQYVTVAEGASVSSEVVITFGLKQFPSQTATILLFTQRFVPPPPPAVAIDMRRAVEFQRTISL